MGNTMSFRKDFGLIIVGAVIFTASFLWKDLFSDIEELYFPKINGICGRFLFTLVVTVILVLIAVHLKGFFGINDSRPVQFDDDPNRGGRNGGTSSSLDASGLSEIGMGNHVGFDDSS